MAIIETVTRTSLQVVGTTPVEAGRSSISAQCVATGRGRSPTMPIYRAKHRAIYRRTSPHLNTCTAQLRLQVHERRDDSISRMRTRDPEIWEATRKLTETKLS